MKISPRLVGNLVVRGIFKRTAIPGVPRISHQSLCNGMKKLYVGHGLELPGTFPTDWMTAGEAGEYLDVSIATVLRWARDRKIPYYNVGSHTKRFRAKDLNALCR